MRITSSMMGDQFLRGSNRALSLVNKYNLQVASGKRLTSIADDPASTTAVLRARTKLYDLADYQSNISTASSYLKEVEAAVSDMDELLQDVYGEVISAISGGKTPEDLRAIAAQVRNLRDEVFAIGNQSIGTSYLFGGYNFTGTQNGTLKTPPFYITETGDLIYNGINLSMQSWSDEYNDYTDLMDSYTKNISEIVEKFNPSTFSDGYAKDQCDGAYKLLSSLISAGENALYAAKQCDIETGEMGDESYKALEKYISDLKSLGDSLYNEMFKELKGDYVVDPATVPDGVPFDQPGLELKDDGTLDFEYYKERGINVYGYDEYLNKFDSDKVEQLLQDINDMLTDATDGLSEVVTPLKGKIEEKLNTVGLNLTVPADPTTIDKTAFGKKLTEELNKESKLTVGLNNDIKYTTNGLEIMGTGNDNLYHILDKIVRILEGEIDEKELTGAISQLQEAQSRTLTHLTSIGANQNRLTLLSNRYDTNQMNYNLMRSNAEEVDLAEASINLATAKTVYNAALAGGAQILRTSLIDYLR